MEFEAEGAAGDGVFRAGIDAGETQVGSWTLERCLEWDGMFRSARRPSKPCDWASGASDSLRSDMLDTGSMKVLQRHRREFRIRRAKRSVYLTKVMASIKLLPKIL